jgi:hypothetical protein
MQGACAASNPCKVASPNGQPFGQKNKNGSQKTPFWPILAHKWPDKRPAPGFQGGQSGCMHGACAASNACKVASSNGQSFGQNKKRQTQMTILAHLSQWENLSNLKAHWFKQSIPVVLQKEISVLIGHVYFCYLLKIIHSMFILS